MSINVVAHNLLAMNAERNLGINTKSKVGAMEKLSSGYRINRSADDAAGLAISEKMRRLVRGLNQGTENAQDGASWVQIGDGSLEEAHSMLHRMTQLSVQSLNGTWTDSDRAAMQAEFEQLQKEIDRLTDATTFNEKHIFAEHDIPYYQFEGNIQWMPNQKHLIGGDNNVMNITYRMTEREKPQTVSIQVPMGQYTTKELMDEIDTALEKAGLLDKGMVFEYTTQGTCNLNLEGGTSIDAVTGGLSYLLHDVYGGGSTGALIGTTTFESDKDDVRLTIKAGKNDEIEFDVVSLDGTSEHIKLKVPTDASGVSSYSRPELMTWLEESLKKALDGTGKVINVEKDGQCIKLTSDDSIITRLKGNMFKLDNKEKGEKVYTSIFYDNIGYGPVEQVPAVLIGGEVLSTKRDDLEHGSFLIDSSNNTLRVSPNGSDTVTTLTIPDGYYTASEMATKLNELFKGLGLKADYQGDKNQGDEYQRLIITSEVSGLGSDVGIDKTSSAYDTLFVTRAYNKLEQDEDYIKSDTRADNYASYTGGKQFSSGSWPMEITAGKNDKFRLTVDGKTYEITLDTGVDGVVAYDNLSGLTNAVKKAIDKVKDTLTDDDEKARLESIRVTTSSSRVYLEAQSNSVDNIAVDGIAGNSGYAELFTTTVNYSSTQSTLSKGVATLNTPITDDDFPLTIYSSKQNFTIYVDNEPHTLKLPAGPYHSLKELEDAINNHPKLPKAEVKDEPRTFSVNKTGTNSVFEGLHNTGKYKPLTKDKSYEGKGDDGGEEGYLGSQSQATVAETKIELSYFKSPLVIDDTNNKITMKVNGTSKIIELPKGAKYTSVSALAKGLQTALNDDAAFGKGEGGVDVSSNGNTLILKTRRKGEAATISCGTSDSNFLKYINTDMEAAYVSLNKYTLKNETKIEKNKTDTFIFKYNGVEKKLKLEPKANGGGYTKAELVEQINTQLDKQNIGVHAELVSGSYLRLTEDTPGDGNKLEFDSAAPGNTAVKAIYSDAAAQNQPLSVTIGRDIDLPLDLPTGKQFTITVNGTSHTVDMPAGKFTDNQKFVDALNTKLKGTGVTATLDDVTKKRIKLTTTETGSTASIKLSHSEAWTPVFGTDTVIKSGIEAKFNSSGRLTLTAKLPDGTKNELGNVVVYSGSGSIFQTAKETPQRPVDGTSRAAYRSKIYSAIEGAPLRYSTVKINQWNKELSFRYYYNGTYRNILLTGSNALPEGEYSYEALREELEKRLNANVTDPGAMLKVEVSADGVKIKAGNPGSRYSVPETYYDSSSRKDVQNFSGGFYYNVIRRTAEKMQKTKPVETKGRNENATYAVGRKDIRNQKTLITKGVNDTLTLDFTYGDKVETISMTLDAGNYSGSGLVEHIQKKMNEQLEAKGLEPNLIQAQVGGVNTGVYGNHDKDALVLRLADNVKLPSNDPDAQYIIDGIGGNAAFSVFYQTDGDIRIAYVTGTKDVSNGVNIPKNSDLTFDVDGTSYKITMPAGRYSQEKMLEELNTQLKAAGAPVTAKMDGRNLTLSHTKYGKHQITNISGDAKRWLFYQENGAKEGEKDIWIRVGSESGDGVIIERPAMNTSFLGINSVTISKPKYAAKALDRVKKAVTKVSEVRSYFGSMQNRLEHTINKNNNTAENTQAAESAIRDADMSKEILSMSRAGILENVSQSMLAQANRSRQDVLSLLQ